MRSGLHRSRSEGNYGLRNILSAARAVEAGAR
jgi:hypothetical protein